MVARRLLQESALLRGQVVDHLGAFRGDGFGVEDDHIGLVAAPQQSALGQFPSRRHIPGEHLDSLLQRELAGVAHPVGEYVGLQRAVHDLRDVRAAVAEGHQRARLAHDLQHGVLVLVGQRHHVDRFEVLLDADLQHRLDGVFLALAREFAERAVGRAVDVIEDEDPVPVGRFAGLGRHHLGEVLLFVVGDMHQFGAGVGVAERRQLFVERALAQIAPEREAVEGHLGAVGPVGRQLAGMGLSEHPRAARGGLRGVVEPALPAVGRGAAARERGEEDRAAGVHGEVAQAVLVVVGIVRVLAHRRLAADLDHPAVERAQLHHEFADLAPIGQTARHRVAFGGLVRGRAGGGEAHRAGLHGLAQQALHFGAVRLARGLGEGALAHHVGAQRGVPHVAAVVQPLGRLLQEVEVFGEGFPGPGDAGALGVGGDILHRFQRAHQQVLIVGMAGGEREAAVAHDHGGHAVVGGRCAVGVPGNLSVEVGVSVDEAGRDDQAVGVDLFASGVGDPSDRGDPPVLDGQVRAHAGRSRAVHNGSAPNHDVVAHANPHLSLLRCVVVMVGEWERCGAADPPVR